MSVSGPELTPVQGAEGHPLLVDTCLWVPSLWGPRAPALNGGGGFKRVPGTLGGRAEASKGPTSALFHHQNRIWATSSNGQL